MMDTDPKTCSIPETTSVLWFRKKNLMKMNCQFIWSNIWKMSSRRNCQSGSVTKTSWSLTRISRAATWTLSTFTILRTTICWWRSTAIPEEIHIGFISRFLILEWASPTLSISTTSLEAWRNSTERVWMWSPELRRRINWMSALVMRHQNGDIIFARTLSLNNPKFTNIWLKLKLLMASNLGGNTILRCLFSILLPKTTKTSTSTSPMQPLIRTQIWKGTS